MNFLNKHKTIIIGLLIVVFSYSIISGYLINHFLLILLVIGSLLGLYIHDKKQTSWRLLIPALTFGVIYLITNLKSAYYLCFLLGMFAVIENRWGKLNYPVIFIGLVTSPVFYYVNSVIGFDVRLRMSEWIAKYLNVLPSVSAYSEGNTIMLNNSAYTIDPACIGLNMSITTLVFAAVTMAYFERIKHFKFSFTATILFFSLAYISVIIANVARIVSLVILDAQPDTLSHEMVGIVSMFFYSCLPLYLFFRRMSNSKLFHIKKLTKHIKNAKRVGIHTIIPQFAISLCLLILFWGNIRGQKEDKYRLTHPIATKEIEGYQKTILDNNIIKYYNDKHLLYVKPPIKFYEGGHNAMFCWRGEGYEFTQTHEIGINNGSIMTAILKKDDERLYTAWWFSDGIKITHSEFDWRKSTVQSRKPFLFYNLTTHSKEELDIELQRLVNP